MKIGILLDSHKVPKYLIDFLNWLDTSKKFQLQGLHYLPQPHQKNYIFRFLLLIIYFWEKRYLKNSNYKNILDTYDLKKLHFPIANSLFEIKDSDLIIYWGHNHHIEKLQLSPSTQIIHIDLGYSLDNFFAFWPVYHKDATSPLDIISLKGKTKFSLLKGQLLTQASYFLNKAYTVQKSLDLLKNILSKNFPIDQKPALVPILKNPTNHTVQCKHLFSYLLKRIFRILVEKLKSLKGTQEKWLVSFSRTSWENLDFKNSTHLQCPKLSFIADPFLIHKNKKDFCFLEEYDYQSKLGFISVYEIIDNNSQYLGPVLKENFHLSFPFLFEYQGTLYMCPETSQSREIRLYECIEFPEKWKFKISLIKNIVAVDSMIFEKNGKWWLFTNIDSSQKGDHCTELHIFFSDSPLSQSWTPHPLNPVIVNPLIARNAGLLKTDDKLFRVSQTQEFRIYGHKSNINEILVLNENQFEEQCIKQIEPTFLPNIHGTHHIHSLNKLTVFDHCRMEVIPEVDS